MKVLPAIISLLLLLTSCHAVLTPVKAPLEQEGELFIYTKAFPREAERISFTLAGVSAIKDDGAEYPLTLTLAELQGREMKRQRLLASGQLPPGNYLGLLFTVKKARLRTEEGMMADLLTPAKGTRVDFAFTVTRKKASLLSLGFNPERAVSQGFAFTPSFTVTQPGRPVPGLVGYVTNSSDNTITVFDKQAREVVAVIATGRKPAGLVVNQPSRKAYVALTGEDAIDVVDMATSEFVNRVKLNPGDNPLELALTPDGRTLFAANSGSNTVSIIDPQSSFELARISVGNSPETILLDPAGQKAFVFNALSDTVSVIDIQRRALVATFATESGPSRGQFNRRGDALYLAHEKSGYLTLMNPASLAILQRYYVGMGLDALKVDTASGLVYAGKVRAPDIDLYEPFSFIPVARIGSGGNCVYLTIDGDENNLLVVNGVKGTLQFVNLVDRKVIAEIDVGADPYRVALIGER